MGIRASIWDYECEQFSLAGRCKINASILKNSTPSGPGKIGKAASEKAHHLKFYMEGGLEELCRLAKFSSKGLKSNMILISITIVICSA